MNGIGMDKDNERRGATMSVCNTQNLRLCGDGSCVSRLDLCPEEEEVNQSTVLIMIVVGMIVIVAMIIVYCFQQRSRRLQQQSSSQAALQTVEDGDNSSLNNPPPNYEEVVGSNLYLPTTTSLTLSQPTQNSASLSRLPSATEEPMTPPPNYETALIILAQSHDSIFPLRPEDKATTVVRRSISAELSPSSPSRTSTAASEQFTFRRNFSLNENNNNT